MGQRRGARGAGLAPRRKGLSAHSATSLSLCPGPGGSPKGPSEPWLHTPPPAYSGLVALCSGEAERGRPRGGARLSASRTHIRCVPRRSAHSWKSGGRAGARGPPAPPGEIGRKARARPRARHPPPQPPKTRGRWYTDFPERSPSRRCERTGTRGHRGSRGIS